MNKLSTESSPYLLQHAHNPVHWLPWSAQALEKAKKENKLVIVSIGYAACHWCHVMERESFENQNVADLMNEYFVCIKVDREERPDIDDIYMTACQLSSRRGCGWPLNAFALPDGRPVWAGTYFPRENWIQILESFAVEMKNNPEKLVNYADQLTRGIELSDTIHKKVEIHKPWDRKTLALWIQNISNSMDHILGGSMSPPKFPMSGVYDLLMEYEQLQSEPKINKLINTSLDRMSMGGLYDQVGGGFARYSVDAQWKVPHFEKMLYDNGQLMTTYALAFQKTKKPEYENVLRQTASFLRTKWTTAAGGFMSSYDADSEGEEGLYYLWTESELHDLIPQGFFSAFKDYYNILPDGNWENSNILFADQSSDRIASKYGIDPQEFVDLKRKSLNILLRERSSRVEPALDDKILTSWNALMLRGLLKGYRALGEEELLKLALQNAHFIESKATKPDGGLYRDCKSDSPTILGFIEDYAYVIESYIELYQVTLEEKWLWRALELTEYTTDHFVDSESGMFFTTDHQAEAVVTRKMILTDNVIPSPNSVMAHNLFTLGRILDKQEYRKMATQMLHNIMDYLREDTQMRFYYNWGRLYLRMLQPQIDIAILGPKALEYRKTMQAEFTEDVLYMGSVSDSDLPLLRGKSSGEATLIYVCADGTCRIPTTSPGEALQELKELRKSAYLQ